MTWTAPITWASNALLHASELNSMVGPSGDIALGEVGLATTTGDIFNATGNNAMQKIAIDSNGKIFVRNVGNTASLWDTDVIKGIFTTPGDIVYANGNNTYTRLAATQDGKILTSTGSAPQWVYMPPFTTAGDLVYGTGSGTVSRLALGTNLQALRVNGGATAPTWGNTVLGTGLQPGNLVYGTGAGTNAFLGIGSNGQYLWNNAGTPAWATIQGITLIATSTSAGAGINFTSIPGSYTGLLITGMIRSGAGLGGAGDVFGLRFNSDTTDNYSSQVITSSNATVTTQGFQSTSIATIMPILVDAGAPAGLFDNIVIYIPNYLNTGKQISFNAICINKLSATAGKINLYSTSGFWQVTGAITRIDLLATAAGNIFVTGSTVSLYGIP